MQFIILGIFLISLGIIKFVIPVVRFLMRALEVIMIYDFLKEYDDFTKEKGQMELKCGKYQIQFSNAIEASMELKKIADDALEYYKRLGLITTINSCLKEYEDKLVKISYEAVLRLKDKKN